MNDRALVLAMGKGRMVEETLRLWEQLGYDMEPVREALRDRKMIAEAGPFRVLLAKDADVPIYVEQGAADLGITGRDVLRETGADVLVPLLLGTLIPSSRCRLALISPRATRDRNWRLAHNLTIATKYPNVTQEYVDQQGLGAQVIGLSGNVELAPACGMADLIVDIVQSGTTLRENDLVELDTILACEATLIVNRASQKLRPLAIRGLVERLEETERHQVGHKGSEKDGYTV
ncbi:MAG: ATP phosphoribosyltransferase [Ardenticatenales bacterium]|nr:ATP phosphoribosyltransferase [Ardenticatenales bacterium]